MKLKIIVGVFIVIFLTIFVYYWATGSIFYNPKSVNPEKAKMGAYKAAKEGLFDPSSPPIIHSGGKG